MNEKQLFLQIHPADNLLVALTDLPKGKVISFGGEFIELQDDIRAKHKFTTQALPEKGEAIMYGVLVGKAKGYIPRGGLVHTFNLKHAAQPFAGKQHEYAWTAPDVSAWQHRTFAGYHRADGQVGTRNYWLVIPLVFCENRNVALLKEIFLKELGYAQPSLYQDQLRSLLELHRNGADEAELAAYSFPQRKSDYVQDRPFRQVDGVKFVTHDGGCGESNEDSDNLARLLAGYCLNANVGGITILSLGCQKTQVEGVKKYIYQQVPAFDKPLYYFEQQQDAGSGESGMLAEAIRQTLLGIIRINRLERRPAPLSKLKVGVKCGGSDGFSGISANPAVGHTADLLVALGAQVLMAEFPELCGVEQDLQNRAVTGEVADRFGFLMTEYARRAAAVGAGFDMNPSAGNIKDGLITDAIKSAGATRKGGTSPVTDALGYGQFATRPGLNLVCTPGNDVLATTGMAAAGATLQLFTTGLGTPTGNPVSPMVKIATNTTLANKLPEIIDLDCGPIITGEKTVAGQGEEILEYLIGLASGEYRTRAEGLGQDDFLFWRRGISL
jgi:altronate hydrolase